MNSKYSVLTLFVLLTIFTPTQAQVNIKKGNAQPDASATLVYSQADTKDVTVVVPEIYQTAEIQQGWIVIDNDWKVGERVKITTEYSTEIYRVTAAQPTRFRVKELATNHSQLSTVFVYGRQVNDFHTVDHAATSTLNISDAQQLVKEIKQLKQEHEKLKTQVEKIAQLEAMLQQLNTPVQPISNTIPASK